jgi:endonuclease YncB( thermonuclease family)
MRLTNSYRIPMPRVFIAIGLMLISTSCLPAKDGSCVVKKIYDGDTVTLTCPGQADDTKVRMYCIDTPEMKQTPWGEKSRDNLRGMIAIGDRVKVVEIDKDRYGRVVGEVLTMSGKNLNMEQVKSGFAAVYDAYCKKPEYKPLEAKAKSSKLGIWAKSGMQQTPWEWRKEQREAD